MDFKLDLCICCFGLSFLFIFIILLTIFPIMEIYFAITFGDDVVCDSSLNISIKNWLLIKASTSFVVTALVILCYMASNKSCLYYLVKPITVLFNLFYLVWIIIGSIIFWRDCINLQPQQLNTFMYFSLIFGYICIFNMLTATFNKEEEEKKKKKKKKSL